VRWNNLETAKRFRLNFFKSLVSNPLKLESAKSSDELGDTLQSIIDVEEDMGAVCLC
jgi:hypothetical protein